eukprot:759574-Hanusia_phi.AAC.10
MARTMRIPVAILPIIRADRKADTSHVSSCARSTKGGKTCDSFLRVFHSRVFACVLLADGGVGGGDDGRDEGVCERVSCWQAEVELELVEGHANAYNDNHDIEVGPQLHGKEHPLSSHHSLYPELKDKCRQHDQGNGVGQWGVATEAVVEGGVGVDVRAQAQAHSQVT